MSLWLYCVDTLFLQVTSFDSESARERKDKIESDDDEALLKQL